MRRISSCVCVCDSSVSEICFWLRSNLEEAFWGDLTDPKHVFLWLLTQRASGNCQWLSTVRKNVLAKDFLIWNSWTSTVWSITEIAAGVIKKRPSFDGLDNFNLVQYYCPLYISGYKWFLDGHWLWKVCASVAGTAAQSWPWAAFYLIHQQTLAIMHRSLTALEPNIYFTSACI